MPLNQAGPVSGIHNRTVWMGIHPNSFLCASICGSVMAACGFNMTARHWHKQILSLAIYTAVTGALASIFVGISFLFDARLHP